MHIKAAYYEVFLGYLNLQNESSGSIYTEIFKHWGQFCPMFKISSFNVFKYEQK